jgi:hypothetical protein
MKVINIFRQEISSLSQFKFHHLFHLNKVFEKLA